MDMQEDDVITIMKMEDGTESRKELLQENKKNHRADVLISTTLEKLYAGGWNHDRCTIPDLLRQQQVPLDTWQATYDAVLQLNQQYPRKEYTMCAMTGAILVVAAFVVSLATANNNKDNTNDPWTATLTLVCIFSGTFLWMYASCIVHRPRNIATGRLWRQQVELYRPYGIAVMFVVQAQTTATGLKFSLSQQEQQQPYRNQPSSLSMELQGLYDLYSSGALTDKEYVQAKGIVLNDFTLLAQHHPHGESSTAFTLSSPTTAERDEIV